MRSRLLSFFYIAVPLLAGLFGFTRAAMSQSEGAKPGENPIFTMRPPRVPAGFSVRLYAHEPMLHNPCAMSFDARGRLTVSHGPQYRGPRPETPGDQILILHDDNDDGVADRSVVFAEGLNSVQGIAWRGDQLWIANSPELTVVRDLDGDDRADEYVRVYTDLGNLEHALHGLNWAPDGMLYMSKGNSKGHNRPDRDGRVAPRTFRDLLGLAHPNGAPDYPPSPSFTREQYYAQGKGYHDPADDWGREGGILRCDRHGRNLEIVARGFRNPWDITCDDEFTWFGTDNDQNHGDKIFTPFYGAHFGWGHAWSYDWFGKDHLPTIPASAPLFEGSGTGVLFYTGTQFPEAYRHVFFSNDWLSLRTNVYRPAWDGALRVPADEKVPLQEFASESGGSLFRPSDIEMGPDGAVYIASWGQDTGAQFETGANGDTQVDEGRIYKISYDGARLPSRSDWFGAHRARPHADWSVQELLHDLGPASLPVWRTNAQDELIRRGEEVRSLLVDALQPSETPRMTETWIVGTLGQIPSAKGDLCRLASQRDPARINLRRQAIGALALSARHTGGTSLPDCVAEAAGDPDSRTRFAAVQAIWQAKDQSRARVLIDAAAREEDRIVYYVIWHTMRDLVSARDRRALLADPRPAVRRAALLGLMDRFEISKEDVLKHLETDSDEASQRWGLKWILSGAPPRIVSNEPERVESADNLSASDVIQYLESTQNPQIRWGLWGMLSQARPQGDDWQRARVLFDQVRSVNAEDRKEHVAALRALGHDPRALPIAWDELATHRPGSDHASGTNPHRSELYDAAREILSQNVAAPQLLLEVLPTAQPTELQEIGLGLLAAHAPPAAPWPSVEPMVAFLEQTCRTTPDPRRYAAAMSVLLAMDGPQLQQMAVSRASLRQLAQESANHADVRVYSQAERLARHLNVDVKLMAREAASIEQVLECLPRANPAQGEKLFFEAQRANCGACHQVGARGTQIAPALADVGRRVLPREIIESILHPSRKIVQGFAVTHVTTTDGRLVSGVVKGETNRLLQLFQSDGKVVDLPKRDIEERVQSDTSLMPANFGALLSVQELADVVAWLMTQPPPSAPVSPNVDVGPPPAATPTIEMAQLPGQVVITVSGQPLASYQFRDPHITRPYFANVHAPGGIAVGRNHPPRAGDSIDHADLHPGLFLAFGDISGNDSWRLEAKVVHDQFVEGPSTHGPHGSFRVKNRYLSKDGDRVVCEEVARYSFSAEKDAYRIDWDSTFSSQEHDFTFGDQEEMGLGFRLATALREQDGQVTFLNSVGQRGAAETWGQPSEWCFMSGAIREPVAVMIMSSPSNLRPSWWHNRSYGLSVANLFGRAAMRQGEPSTIVVRKGESFRLAYRILLATSPQVELDPAAEYQGYCRSMAGGGGEKRSD